MAAEVSREARMNRLRRAGWEPGTPYPGVDEQAEHGESQSFSNFSFEYSTEFD
jgi:hypothetical protein